MKTYRRVKLCCLISFIFICFISCNKDFDDPFYISLIIKESIYNGMQEWYYWNKELPQNVNIRNYQSNEELLEALRFKPIDKWSFLTTTEAFQRTITGQDVGHGVGYTIDNQDRIFLSFVYEESPAGKDGWQRGWEVVEVNGRPVSSYRRGNGYDLQLGPDRTGITNAFTFRLADGSLTERTIPKSEYQSNSVLFQDVLDVEGRRIGYWVYNSFRATPQVEPTKSLEVEESMAYFEDHQIQELIIDLRYNGGGSVDVAEQVMNYLIPAEFSGRLMYTDTFNENRSSLNKESLFDKIGHLQLERLIFITSRGSASSSELIINCLSPYMELTLIGDNTYGKPVGAFPLSGFYKPLREHNVELVPITFAIANAEGKAAYFDGFPADFHVEDDPTRNWGNLEEKRLKTALEFIRSGTVGEEGRISYSSPPWAMIDNFEGLKQEFPAY